MKKIRPWALVLAAALLAGGLFGGQRALADDDPLVVGVRADVMNFGYQNPTTGRYYGLEVDLAYELADRLGRDEAQFVTVTPSDREEKLANGDVDCIIACFTITAAREERVDFSPAYYHDRTVIMVQKSSRIQKLEDLAGLTVGVLENAVTGDLVVRAMRDLSDDGVTLYASDSYQALSDALEQGDVDALCLDGCIAQAFMNDDRLYLDETLSTQFYGVATRKYSQLSKDISTAMQDILDDGTMDEILDKWD